MVKLVHEMKNDGTKMFHIFIIELTRIYTSS